MKKRAQKRDKRERKRKKSKLSLLLKLLITVAVLAGLYFFASSSYFNVTSFEVSGNSYYTEEEILIMGGCQTGGNIFWGSDVGQIRERLERDAYMEKVKIRRALPNTIKIELTERKQVAAVVYDDNYAVIDEDGLVLRKSSVAPHLPLIQGLTITRKLGRFVEFSVFGSETSVDWSIIGDRKELDILGSHLSPYAYPFVIENMMKGNLKTDGVVSSMFKIEEWEKAFDYASGKYGDFKVAFKFE